jgi:hypothetical protein
MLFEFFARWAIVSLLNDILWTYIGFYSLYLLVPFVLPEIRGQIVLIEPFTSVFRGAFLLLRDVRELFADSHVFLMKSSFS